ncbi:MAG: hypothetical protein ACRDWT_01315 [Jatrophihabitantaceae bacterium]
MAANELRRAALTDGLVQGVLFGLAMGLLVKLSYHASWTHTVGEFAVTGSLFGAFSTFLNRGNRRQRVGILAGLTSAQCRQARRAAERGPLPQDVLLRARAAELAQWSQQEWRRVRGLNTVVLVVVLVGCVMLALTGSPWWWITVPWIGANLAKVRVWPARLRRRAELLRAG